MEEETETKNTKENIEAIKKAKKESKDKSKVTGENYLIITFQSIEIKEAFLEKMDCDGNSRYIDGDFLIKKMK